ncbi:polysaccharide deacetylase family protein [Chitiniphilus eburneus]|nr:polysaccharide deacetylase family protein [Chitiniphilus eburneus]
MKSALIRRLGCIGLIAFASLAYAKEPKIRTPFLEGWEQVPLEQMERQAKTYPDVYWIEGPGESKVVAFTFDDGPNPLNTPPLLKVLKKHGVHATFFQLGMWVEKYPDLARKVLADGHVLGNHSYSHPYASKLTNTAFWENEVAKTQAIFQRELGFMPTLYRPPYGEITDSQVELLRDKGIKVISWSVDTRDWLSARAMNGDAQIEGVVTNYVHPEAIVLMHDGGGPRDRTVEAVDRLIGKLKEQGYTFVTIDKLIGVAPKLAPPAEKPVAEAASAVAVE